MTQQTKRDFLIKKLEDIKLEKDNALKNFDKDISDIEEKLSKNDPDLDRPHGFSLDWL